MSSIYASWANKNFTIAHSCLLFLPRWPQKVKELLKCFFFFFFKCFLAWGKTKTIHFPLSMALEASFFLLQINSTCSKHFLLWLLLHTGLNKQDNKRTPQISTSVQRWWSDLQISQKEASYGSLLYLLLWSLIFNASIFQALPCPRPCSSYPSPAALSEQDSLPFTSCFHTALGI